MKKIIYFIPLIFGLIFIGFMYSTGSVEINILPVFGGLLCFAISGVLLSYNKAWGSIFSLIVSGVIVYEGTNNWKLGKVEIILGVILALYYISCAVFVYKTKSS